MRVTTVLLGCAACLLLIQPGMARGLAKVTVSMSKPGMTADQIQSDRLSCVRATTAVNYAPPAFIRCMEIKGYTLNPAGYRLTLLIRQPARQIGRPVERFDDAFQGPPAFVDVRHEQ